MKMDSCIFCKIVAGEIPSRKLYEDENYIVILDLGPAARGHALVIPKEHYKDLYELPEEKCGEVLMLSKKMAAHMTEKLKCDGFNLVQNNGEAAGQTVHHFHMHLIPRYDYEEVKNWWTPGNPTPEELVEVKRVITE